MIKNAVNQLLYAVFPRRCKLCGEVVEINESLCRQCNLNIEITGERCLKCGLAKDDCCCAINRKKPSYNGIVAPFYYSEGIIRAIHRLKFYGYKELALEMAKYMADTVKTEYKDIDFDYVTFVPMTKKHLRKREYNQAQLLSSCVAKQIDTPCIKLLDKIRETQAQRSNSARERRTNLFGAFDLCNGVDVKNKRILLVDDVKTTGSTLNECSQVLKAYGAAEVYACTLAITKIVKGDSNELHTANRRG